MIKFYCDYCGQEIPSDVVYYPIYGEHMEIKVSLRDNKHVCLDCVMAEIAWIKKNGSKEGGEE